MSEHLQIANLTFEVRRSSRRRTLGLTVDRYGELLVHAPDNASTDELQEWTKKKLAWVYRRLVVKESYTTRIQPPAFVTGERFNYLGRSYPLRLVTQLSQPLSFDGTKFCLRREARPQATRYFKQWYSETGRGWLADRVKRLARRTTTNAFVIDVRDLGFRWGSCGKNSVLYFDWRVLQLPVRLIDYVIVHELVHLREPHHRPKFWQSVERAVPEWERRRKELDNRGAEYLVFATPRRMHWKIREGDRPGIKLDFNY
jgi:predicted metal-dependent hydrolase